MLLRLYGLFLVGAIPVAVLATLDVQDRAGHYYDDLHSQVRQLQLGLVLSIIAGVLLVVLWPLAKPRLHQANGTPPITPGRDRRGGRMCPGARHGRRCGRSGRRSCIRAAHQTHW